MGAAWAHTEAFLRFRAHTEFTPLALSSNSGCSRFWKQIFYLIHRQLEVEPQERGLIADVTKGGGRGVLK